MKTPVGRKKKKRKKKQCVFIVAAPAGCVSVWSMHLSSRRSRPVTTAAVCAVQLWPVSTFCCPTHTSKTCLKTDS